ncbi:hypothetical protein H0H93_009116 [Arthromyces matolae]|nr:hypothetical protein H0H93_009116 [Arthromyces matolae]
MSLPAQLATDGEQPPLLTLACRFVPYDQWLTTHVDAGWKVKQVKLWILYKCLGIPLDTSLFPSSASRSVLSDPLEQQGITASGQRYRPKSPITFAPDPRTLKRATSPILFANKKGKGKGKADGPEGDNLAETTPSASGSPVDGYEEDDEWDAEDDGNDSLEEAELYRRSPPPPLPQPLAPRAATPVLPTPPTSGKWARYNLSPNAYTLIRFTTGQALEDDLSLTFFDLLEHELLELHAHGDVCSPPAIPLSSLYQPSYVPSSDHGHGGHTRSSSIYSVSASTPSLPPVPHKPKDKDKDGPQRSYIARLNRFDSIAYIEPYWEGPVRELRSVPVRSFMTAPMPNFLNGYGYGYAGADFNERAMALGIGHPPPFGLQHQHSGMPGMEGGRQNKIEWRPRHLVVKDKLLTLCMNREDQNPRQIVAVEALTSLHGVTEVINYLRSQEQPHSTSRYHHHSHDSQFSPKFDKDRRQGPRVAHGSTHSSSNLGPVFSSISNDSDESDSDSHSHYRRPNHLHTSHHPYPSSRSSQRASLDTTRTLDPHQSDKSEPKIDRVGGELLDDLFIVVLKFRSVDKLKRVVSLDKDGLMRETYVREEKELERHHVDLDIERKAKKKEKDKKKKKEREEEKKKGKGFPWDRDREKKEKEKGKRDWIPAFGGKKDKDKDKGSLTFSSLGMGVSLGLGLSGGQDTKELFIREREREIEREREREKLALSEADAEAKIIFARHSNGTSEDDNGVGLEEEGTAEDGERDDVLPTKLIKGKGRATYEEGEASAEEIEPGAESDLDARSQASYAHGFQHKKSLSELSHSHNRRTIRGPSQPHEDKGAAEVADDAASEAWSSPVFAHSDSNTDIASEGDLSDIGLGSPIRSNLRAGYRYGYQGMRSMEVGGVEPEPLHEEEDRLEKERANFERRKMKERARKREEEIKRENEKTESIILDMGSELAFKSFLRVLHRYLSPTASSYFLPSPPVLPSPTPTSTATPTPTPTPFPSPTFPRGVGSGAQAFQWMPSSDEEAPDESSTLTSSSNSHKRRSQLVSPLSASSETSGHDLSQQHPAALAVLAHSGPGGGQTFGVLPFPEWRIEVTMRAQRCGMGEVGRAMKWVKWESKEGSEAEWLGWMADLHRQRHITGEKRREEAEKREMEVFEALTAARDLSDGEHGQHLPVPSDGTDLRRRRAMLEPTGIIVVKQSEGLDVSYSTPSGTLYSPSSSDSLNPRGRFSPVERSSSPAGTSAHSHHGHVPPAASPLGARQPIFSGSSGINHSTSTHSPPRPEARSAEQNLRRPSMPILTSDQTFSLHQGSIEAQASSTVIRSPMSFTFPASQPGAPPSPFSPDWDFAVRKETRESSSSTALPPRRASSAGLMTPTPSGSVGRSTNVFPRKSLLKKDTTKEERLREKERRKEEKAKEKEDKAKEKERIKELEKEAKGARRAERPKLSLATSSTHQLVSQPSTSISRTTSRIETSRSLLRKVKSGSNLNEERIAEETATTSARGGNAAPQGVKKKRTVFVNRFVRGLDSAMDFVDGL